MPEQIEIGREIALNGRDYFRRRAPVLSNEEQQRTYDAKHYIRGQKIKIIVVAILLFGPCIVFISSTPRIWVPFLIALVPILVPSLCSFLHARARYHKWIDEMLAIPSQGIPSCGSSLPRGTTAHCRWRDDGAR
jgi:hypothetical protein